VVSPETPTTPDSELHSAEAGGILVVDDDAATRALIRQWLRRGGLRVVEAASGEAALDLLVAKPEGIDLIVLDVMMPGMDGFELLRRLKAEPSTARIPIVFLSASAGESDVVRGVKAGAIDYLQKPFSGPILVTKVQAVLERSRAERALHDKLRSAEESATQDGLTGLANRRAFDRRLAEMAATAIRHSEPLSLVMLDIDRFKSINDSLGHLAGDAALQHLAGKLRAVVRSADQAFRYGGEEFSLLLEKCDRAGAVHVYERLQKSLRAAPLDYNEETIAFTVSGGIASMETANGFLLANLVGRADDALYAAKRAGRDRVEIEK
jgi:diguanylate cyclase (GGDEF)-like protein